MSPASLISWIVYWNRLLPADRKESGRMEVEVDMEVEAGPGL